MRKQLSGIGIPSSSLSQEEQQRIAIRSSVYTRLNPTFADIFPELVDDSVEVSPALLNSLQRADESSATFFTQPLASSDSRILPSTSSASEAFQTGSAKLPLDRSPGSSSSAPNSLNSSVAIEPPSPQLKPHLQTIHDGPQPEDLADDGSSTSSSTSSTPVKGRRVDLRSPMSSTSTSFSSALNHQTPPQSPLKTTSSSSSSPSPPPAQPVFTTAAEALQHFTSDAGRTEFYVTMLSHLKQTIPEWVSQDSNAPLLRSSGRGIPPLAERYTHSTNPRLTILEFYLKPLGLDEGYNPEAKTEGLWCKLRGDFSTWHKIRSAVGWKDMNTEMPEGEAQREHARQLIVQVLDAVTTNLWAKLRIRIVFTDIDLSGTEGSMRAVFQGVGPTGRTAARETEVERLNLSDTRTSPRSLLSLHKLSNLHELILDRCPSIQKSGKNVFSLLLKKDSIPSLTSLSVVGTSQVMSVTWISEVEQRCPNVKKLYFTRQPGVKALGWSDNVMMQTMRDPLLLPCGHIGDRASLLSLGYCALDRQPFRVSELASLHPNITLLEKDELGKWNATIVDVGRKPLDPKVLYHRHCGSFYNVDTIRETYDIDTREVNNDMIDEIRAQTCHYCQKAFGSNTRICYPHSAESSDKHNFDNLKDVSTYGALPGPSSSQAFF